MTVEAETTCLKDFFFAFVLNNLLGFWVFCFVCLFLSPWDRKKEQGVADSFVIIWDHPFRAGGERRDLGWITCIHGRVCPL